MVRCCFFLIFVTLFLLLQGKDINHKHDRKVHRTAPKSEDPYLRLLVKVCCHFVLEILIFCARDVSVFIYFFLLTACTNNTINCSCIAILHVALVPNSMQSSCVVYSCRASIALHWVLHALFDTWTRRYCLWLFILNCFNLLLFQGSAGKTVVVVGTVTDDARVFTIPKLTVCLCFILLRT
jgi:hypothetical protein